MSRRKIPDSEGMQALATWSEKHQESPLDSADVALAVRYALQVLHTRAPGKSVEVRVPPFGAGQIVEGTRHTRGTPPATVELSPDAFLQLATGTSNWEQLLRQGAIQASGERSDIREFFPLWPLS